MILTIFSNFSGSFFFIHRIFGAVKPANAIFAVYWESLSLPITLFRYSVSLEVRPSFQRIAGRITWSWASNVTSPCIWPPKLIPATCERSMPSVSSFIPSILFSYQSSGFCSDQPGCGKNSGYSFETILQIFPDSSIRRSFTAEVPRSTPIKYILILLISGILLETAVPHKVVRPSNIRL